MLSKTTDCIEFCSTLDLALCEDIEIEDSLNRRLVNLIASVHNAVKKYTKTSIASAY